LVKIILAGSEIAAQTLGVLVYPRFYLGFSWRMRYEKQRLPTRRSFSITKIGSNLNPFCLRLLGRSLPREEGPGARGWFVITDLFNSTNRIVKKRLDFWGNKLVNRNIRLAVIGMIESSTVGTVKLCLLANNGWHRNLQNNK
jgi:hypothetical protein